MMFVLANQQRRHSMLRGVAGRVNETSFECFVELVDDPDFDSKLQHAIDHPNSKDAKQFMRKVACSCGRRHVEMRCVDMWRSQLSCMSHPVAIFACLLVHTARGSTVALSALHPGHSCRFSFRAAVQHLQRGSDDALKTHSL